MLKEQREKLLKNEETVVRYKKNLQIYILQTLKEIEQYFAEIRNKRQEEKTKAEEDKKQKREAAKQQAALNRLDKKMFTFTVSKSCSQNFKSLTRDGRERLLSKLDNTGNGAPEVGKYNPKFD